MQTEDKCKKMGDISVDTEHIFPIIKKWLYSEKDIFLREIVSNAADAITKLKRLSSLGIRDAADESYRINVILDTDEKTITVSDNGIGMTQDELEKYICNIAFSGAVEFIQKYENESSGAQNGIIGHFGLGFYSSFMVSERVEVITRSYTDTPAVHWICSGDGSYETLDSATRDEHGTTVIMHISDEEKEYLSSSKLRDMLNKYCSFMPVEIFFSDGADKEPTLINETTPLWLKNATECSDDEYKEFYRRVFSDFREPLFHIHINADYPLNFKGILYFPKISNTYESIEGQVKLYYNQVFVADNIKEVIPDYFFMLKGVLDCPELPLNVSRSYLQTNTYVSKLSAHIVKKVADKINSLCLNDNEKYKEIWKDIAPFVEYSCMRDKKFYDRVKSSLLLRLTDGSAVTYDEYLEAAKVKHENIIYYATDAALQAQYISMFESAGMRVALLDGAVDSQFIGVLEQYMMVARFVRVDADLAESLKSGETAEENEALKDLFIKCSNNDKLGVKFESFIDRNTPAILNVSEEARRMDDMMRLYKIEGAGVGMTLEMTLIVNSSSPLIKKISDLINDDIQKAEKIASYVYKVALLSQKKLSSEEMKAFAADSFAILLDY